MQCAPSGPRSPLLCSSGPDPAHAAAPSLPALHRPGRRAAVVHAGRHDVPPLWVLLGRRLAAHVLQRGSPGGSTGGGSPPDPGVRGGPCSQYTAAARQCRRYRGPRRDRQCARQPGREPPRRSRPAALGPGYGAYCQLYKPSLTATTAAPAAAAAHTRGVPLGSGSSLAQQASHTWHSPHPRPRPSPRWEPGVGPGPSTGLG